MLGITHRLPVAASTERSPHPWLRSLWNTVTGAVGVITGLAPHVLHHIGLLAGTALVAGGGGTLLFGGTDSAASAPTPTQTQTTDHAGHR